MICGDDLDRFVAAQAGVYETALAEIHAGRKMSHWMWFVFPQLRSLGRSATAQRYGLADLAEAQAYAAHPVLGRRLREITGAMLANAPASAESVLGPVDAMKLRSCATLFEKADPQTDRFQSILTAFFAGVPCPHTAAEISSE